MLLAVACYGKQSNNIEVVMVMFLFFMGGCCYRRSACSASREVLRVTPCSRAWYIRRSHATLLHDGRLALPAGHNQTTRADAQRLAGSNLLPSQTLAASRDLPIPTCRHQTSHVLSKLPNKRCDRTKRLKRFKLKHPIQFQNSFKTSNTLLTKKRIF